MRNLFECSTHGRDIELLQKLGLKVFKDIPLQKKIKLGSIRIDKIEDENTVSVNVFVQGFPAQFWEFEINLRNKDDNKKWQNILVGTGSGCFSDYWKKLYPLFKELASGMITIK